MSKKENKLHYHEKRLSSRPLCWSPNRGSTGKFSWPCMATKRARSCGQTIGTQFWLISKFLYKMVVMPFWIRWSLSLNLWRIQCAHTHQLLGLLVYVDDLLVLGEEEALSSTTKAIREKWETSEPEDINEDAGVRFLGTELFCQEGRWWMTQTNYTIDLLTRNLGPEVDRWCHRKLPMLAGPETRIFPQFEKHKGWLENWSGLPQELDQIWHSPSTVWHLWSPKTFNKSSIWPSRSVDI